MQTSAWSWLGAAAVIAWLGCSERNLPGAPPPPGPADGPAGWDGTIERNLRAQFLRGRDIFRNDTFGSEAFWGERLGLHRAIAGQARGGVGPGLGARKALELGLKVDLAKLSDDQIDAIKSGSVDLDSPDTTLELLRADAVVGVRGAFDARGRIAGLGITCALCHSTVDDALAAGIGHLRDGWPNRDLNIGAIVSLAPDLSPFEQLLGASREQVTAVLGSWGPGRYDAELNLDGKAARPDGKPAATVLPASFGLAGQNLHTYTGWGSVPYWNAFVANTQMYGKGTFVDRRLLGEQFPLARKTRFYDKRDPVDLITSKLGALQFYQLAIPAPKPDPRSFNAAAAARGGQLFNGKARCATCHVPPLYSEPGWPLHTAAEIGIDDFQASRSPTRMYRTTPLRGLFTRMRPGLYHDGRFPTLADVIDHYDARFQLGLSAEEKADLAEFLKSL